MKRLAGAIAAVLSILVLTFALSVSSSAESRGEAIELAVSTDLYDNVLSGTVSVSYEPSVLTLTGGTLTLGASEKSFDAASGTGSFSSEESFSAGGEIAALSFTVNEEAALDAVSPITATVTFLRQEEEPVTLTIPLGTVTVTCRHEFSAFEKIDDETHSRTCTICGKTETEPHAYSEEWSGDEEGHYHLCIGCLDKKGVEEHTPGDEPTEESGQLCTVCGFELKPKLPHTHKWARTWSIDAATHWFSCAGCGERKDSFRHVYRTGCDPVCFVCGYVRSVSHRFEQKADTQYHYEECAVCGEIRNKGLHKTDPDSSEARPVCLICHLEIPEKPAPDGLSDPEKQSENAADPENDPRKQSENAADPEKQSENATDTDTDAESGSESESRQSAGPGEKDHGSPGSEPPGKAQETFAGIADFLRRNLPYVLGAAGILLASAAAVVYVFLVKNKGRAE